MTPRGKVDLIELPSTPAQIAARFRDTQRSRLPVRDGGEDEIVGLFAARDFLDPAALSGEIDLASLIQPAPVVRDGLAALDVIEAMRKAPSHMLLVYDEYGHFEGIVTPMNLLEAIAGEFADEAAAEPRIVRRDDGSLLVAGWMPADEFADKLGISLPGDRDYATVAGLVLDVMGQLPPVGASTRLGPWRIEVVDLDGRRIDKLLVQKVG
jgi:putative hemolysin